MTAAEQYSKKLYGGETTQSAPSSLYSKVVSPFKKSPEVLTDAFADMDRVIEPPQRKLSNPLQSVLASNKQIEKVSNPLPTVMVQSKSTDPLMPFPTLSLAHFDADKFKKDTIARESGGDSKAKNSHSSAVGKYQFTWGSWGDSIKRVTGVANDKAFMANPQAQDKFMDYYTHNVVAPAVQRLAPLATQYNLTPNQIAKVIHFRGVDGAERAFRNNLMDKKLESYNPTINQYLGLSK
jgi:hypothetical protein